MRNQRRRWQSEWIKKAVRVACWDNLLHNSKHIADSINVRMADWRYVSFTTLQKQCMTDSINVRMADGSQVLG